MDYSWSSPAQAYAVAVVGYCRSKPWQVPIQVRGARYQVQAEATRAAKIGNCFLTRHPGP